MNYMVIVIMWVTCLAEKNLANQFLMCPNCFIIMKHGKRNVHFFV